MPLPRWGKPWAYLTFTAEQAVGDASQHFSAKEEPPPYQTEGETP
jgi:hypothetical protein